MTDESQATKTRKAQAFAIVLWALDTKDWSNETALEFMRLAPNMSKSVFDSYHKACQDSVS